MSGADILDRMLGHKAWANARLFAALDAVPREVVEADQPIVFGSIVRTVHHVYAMDVVWRAHLEGVPHGYTTRRPAQCPPLHEIALKQASMDQWFVDYASGLAASDASQIVRFEFIGGGAGAMSRQDVLLHVASHTSYHRGHVGTMLYAAGIEPPTTDLPVYLRDIAGA